MREKTFREITHSILAAVAIGESDTPIPNPIVAFTRLAKDGHLDGLTDDGYDALMSETEELSAWWHEETQTNSLDLLRSILENCRPNDVTLDAIIDLLVQAYEKNLTPFATNLPDLPDLSKVNPNMPKKKVIPDRPRNFPFRRSNPNPLASDPDFASPENLYNYISSRIHGQREACRAAANLLYHHVHGHHRNLLMVGPSGSGKTEVWRVCRDIYPWIIIVDSNQLTAEGWTGSFKIRDIFAGKSRMEIERSIVVFDEFDKLCQEKGSSSGNYSHIQQDALLKLIEGDKMNFPADKDKPALSFSSAPISFVFLGAFEHLVQAKYQKTSKPSIGFGQTVTKQDAYDQYNNVITMDDVAKYTCMRREIAGRIGSIVQLAPMTADDYREILLTDKISPIRKLEREYRIRIAFDDCLMDQIAQEAADTRMGVRYLNSRVQALLDDAMFRDPSQNEFYIGGSVAATEKERSFAHPYPI